MSRPRRSPAERLAAFDIGSNSIRLQIAEARVASDALPKLRTVIDHRAVTRLGEGVFRKHGRITDKSMEVSFEVFKEMARLCKEYKVQRRRAVATAAVRDAKNRLDFVDEVHDIIKVPVDVISGPEEANLVHLGVSVRWPEPIDRRHLIVDLGGGSVQLVYGSPGGVADTLSRPLGAVRLKELFLKHDPPKNRELRNMHDYVEEKLEIVSNTFPVGSIRKIIVTSGTARAVVCAVHEIPRKHRVRANGKQVSLLDVESLYKRLVSKGLGKRRDISGASERRAQVIVPGVAVLGRILEAFHVRSFTYSHAGVRDGIVADLATTTETRAGRREEHFQVFMCHNTSDKAEVRENASRLRDRGVVPWLDEDQIRPGTPWQPELERQIATIRAAAVFVGRDGIGPWQRSEIDGFLRQFRSRHCPVIPVILPDAKRDPDLPLFLSAMGWVDFRRTRPDPLETLIWGITGERPVSKSR